MRNQKNHLRSQKKTLKAVKTLAGNPSALVKKEETWHSLAGNGGHSDALLSAGMLILCDKLDGTSASLGNRGIVLQGERPHIWLLS